MKTLKDISALDGCKKEILAGCVLIPKSEADRAWNAASERAIRIVDRYIAGDGLFQTSKTPLTPNQLND